MSTTTVPLTFSPKRSSATGRDKTSAAKVLTTGAIGATFLVLSGLTLTGAVMVMIFACPVIVLFSPILVPVGIVLFLAAGGFVFSGGCAVAAITALTWLYRYASDLIAAKRRAYAYGSSFAQIGL